MSEESSNISVPTQEDPSEASPTSYGPLQPEYIPAELVDPPPQVGYPSPAGDQTVGFQDAHRTVVVDQPAPQITRTQEQQPNWSTELWHCCVVWCSTCGHIFLTAGDGICSCLCCLLDNMDDFSGPGCEDFCSLLECLLCICCLTELDQQ